MLRSLKSMEEYTIGAIDGIIGRVKDFYFDDESWVIRYLVVEAGEGRPRRKVLISPIAIGRRNWSQKTFPVSLTRSQVSKSPPIDTDRPLTRQDEIQHLGYYGYGSYWGGGGLWGDGLYPDMLQSGTQPHEAGKQHDGLHLVSGNAVMRYYVRASDGDLGRVQGLLVDESSWAIRYLIVNTSNWWLGHQVLIAPEWIDQVSWTDSTVSLDLTKQSIENSPSYETHTAFIR